jgi:hypothetical protein
MNMFGVSGNLMSLGALEFWINCRWSRYCVEACCLVYSRKTSQITQQEMDNTVLKTSIKCVMSVFGVDYLDCIYQFLLCVVLRENVFANGTNYCIYYLVLYIVTDLCSMMTALFFE